MTKRRGFLSWVGEHRGTMLIVTIALCVTSVAISTYTIVLSNRTIASTSAIAAEIDTRRISRVERSSTASQTSYMCAWEGIQKELHGKIVDPVRDEQTLLYYREIVESLENYGPSDVRDRVRGISDTDWCAVNLTMQRYR